MTVKTTLYLDDRLKDKLDEDVLQLGIKRNQLIQMIIASYYGSSNAIAYLDAQKHLLK